MMIVTPTIFSEYERDVLWIGWFTACLGDQLTASPLCYQSHSSLFG